MFPGKILELCMINERSKLFSFLQAMADAEGDVMLPVKAEEERVCVKIPFPDDYEEYEKGGSTVIIVIICIELTKKLVIIILI